MNMEPQFISAPDGSEMVVLSRAEYDRLIGGAGDDAADIAAADRALAESDVRYPAAVVDAILDGKSPLQAWREHRGLSQAALAGAAGMTQAGISRLEGQQPGGGRPATRRALARALDIPVSALEPIDG